MTVPPPQPCIALIDDDLRTAIAQFLTIHGFAVRAFADARAALADTDFGFPGVVIADVRVAGVSGVSGVSGLKPFEILHARDPELPVILITGHGDVEMAVGAIRAGAWIS